MIPLGSAQMTEIEIITACCNASKQQTQNLQQQLLHNIELL
jgi:hypothetical protein